MVVSRDDPFAAYRLVGTVMAALVLLCSVAEFGWNWANPSSRDFVSFWGAGQMVLRGTPEQAYDYLALHALQIQYASFGTGKMPFPYAPAFLLVVTPFALLPFKVGIIVWSAVTIAIYFWAARRLFPNAGWLPLALPAVYMNGAVGQNGCLTAALFLAALACLPRRPFVAGLLIGCLILKPQLALLIPLALLAGRQWWAIAGAAVSSVCVLLLGLVVFGPEVSTAWISQMPLYAEIGRQGLVGWAKMASVYAAARQLGVPEGAALAVHVAVAMAAAVALWRIWRSDAEMGLKGAALVASAMLASPYIYLYDHVALVAALLWVAERRAAPAWVVALLWCLPLLSVAQIAGLQSPFNINALVPGALMLIVWRAWRKALPADETQGLGSPQLRARGSFLPTALS